MRLIQILKRADSDSVVDINSRSRRFKFLIVIQIISLQFSIYAMENCPRRDLLVCSGILLH